MRASLLFSACFAISGCGLVLDLEPAEDAGMDASVLRDSGVIVSCVSDADCDDDLFCNGAERCAPGGTCVYGNPPGCDDTIACTSDVCDEATDDCVHEANDAACEGSGDCLLGVCVLDVGCTLEPSDGACDDSVACTNDACGRDGNCAHVRDLTQCEQGEICTLTGCSTAPPCTVPGDCPHFDCRTATCPDSACVYVVSDAAVNTPCDSADACADTRCNAEGACVVENTVACPDDPTNCLDNFCLRSADGAVDCATTPRIGCDDGDPCTGTGVCNADGSCSSGSPRCVSTDPCNPMSCAGGICVPGNGPVCGINSSCSDGACECAMGYVDCGGGNDVCDCPVGATGTSPCGSGNVCTTRGDAGPVRVDASTTLPDSGTSIGCIDGMADCDGLAPRCECALAGGANTCISGQCAPSPCEPQCTSVLAPYCCPCATATPTCARGPAFCPLCPATP